MAYFYTHLTNINTHVPRYAASKGMFAKDKEKDWILVESTTINVTADPFLYGTLNPVL